MRGYVFVLFFGDGSIGKSIFADCISVGHEGLVGSRWCRRFPEVIPHLAKSHLLTIVLARDVQQSMGVWNFSSAKQGRPDLRNRLSQS